MAFAGITCIAPSRRVFLMLRSEAVSDPGTWSCPAGRIDYGEEPHEAAIRELDEEAGYDGEVTIVGHIVDDWFPFYHFIATVPDEFESWLNWENDDAGWFDLDDLPAPLHDGWVEIVPVLKELLR